MPSSSISISSHRPWMRSSSNSSSSTSMKMMAADNLDLSDRYYFDNYSYNKNNFSAATAAATAAGVSVNVDVVDVNVNVRRPIDRLCISERYDRSGNDDDDYDEDDDNDTEGVVVQDKFGRDVVVPAVDVVSVGVGIGVGGSRRSGCFLSCSERYDRHDTYEYDDSGSDNSFVFHPKITRKNGNTGTSAASGTSAVSGSASATATSAAAAVTSTATTATAFDRKKYRHHYRRPRKTVRFGNLNVREYPIILGDNPSCSQGPPVTISWKHTKEEVIPVRVYEFHRNKTFTMPGMVVGQHQHLRKRRYGDELKISREERERKLKASCENLTDEDLHEAVRDIVKIQKLRRQTIKNQKYEVVDLIGESLRRKMKRWLQAKPTRSTRKNKNSTGSTTSTTAGTMNTSPKKHDMKKNKIDGDVDDITATFSSSVVVTTAAA